MVPLKSPLIVVLSRNRLLTAETKILENIEVKKYLNLTVFQHSEAVMDRITF